MSIKMKGLVKRLRYISQIFDNEKEREIQIGYPTDVKHVAHIGWDSPSSTNSAPSWMNDFKLPSRFSSAPLGAPVNPKEGGSPKWNSEDLARRGGSIQPCGSTGRDLLELPKSSRRQSSSATTMGNSSLESPTKLKSEKSRQSSRRSAKGSQSHARDLADGASRTSGQTADLESSSPARPDVPKKSRRKKSVGGSSRSSTRSSKGRTTTLTNESPMSDMGSDSGPLSMPEN